MRAIKQPAKIAPSPLAHQIRIISRRADAHSLGGTTKEVTQIVRQVLESIGGVMEGRMDLPVSEYLVQDGVIMGWTCSALKRRVGL